MTTFWDSLKTELSDGLSLPVLEEKIREFHTAENLPVTDEIITLARMNFVGGLRAQGFIIPRTRGFYQITGFAEKTSQTPIDQWPPESRRVLEQIAELPSVTEQSWKKLKTFADEFQRENEGESGLVYHGWSPAVVLAFHLARDAGWFLPDGTIIVRRFPNQPRLRLLNPRTKKVGETAIQLTLQWLSRASRKDPWLVGGDTSVKYPFLTRSRHEVEMRYRIEGLADYPSMLKKLSSDKKYLLKNLGELRLERLDTSPDRAQWAADAHKVIDLWRYGPAGMKQRQLAITRDYVALGLANPHMMSTSYLLYRDNLPVALSIFDVIHDHAIDVVTKALNHPSLPGGYHSTATASTMLIAADLLSQGIRWYQAGSADGATPGLYTYKQKMMKVSGTSVDEGVIPSYAWHLTGQRFEG